jgi:hypothetical protein
VLGGWSVFAFFVSAGAEAAKNKTKRILVVQMVQVEPGLFKKGVKLIKPRTKQLQLSALVGFIDLARPL